MLELSNFADISVAKGFNENNGAHIYVFLYVVDGLLIDCGPKSMEADIVPFLGGEHITQTALTHLHEDHAGMASWVQTNLQVPIYLPSGSIADANSDISYAQYRELTWGELPAFSPLPMPATIRTEKYTFDVIDTPGHLPQHCALLEKDRGWLFSGDLYVRTKPRFCAADEDIMEEMRSIEKVLALDFDTMFCAHKGVLPNGKKFLREKLDYLLELQSLINDHRRRGKTDDEIDKLLFPNDQLIAAISDGDWCSYNLVHGL